MKIFTGKVISKKMQKTATVAVERMVVHPVYKKRIKRIKKYQVHDETGAEVGQVVKFMASKPYSKTKKWKTVEAKKVEKKEKESGRKTLTGAPNRKDVITKGTEKKSENTKKAKGTKRKEGKK